MEPITVTADAEEFTCNAYLVSGEAPTLVDAGTMPGVDDVIADALDEAGVDGLDRVVLTHQHHDHVGQLDAVLDRFDATLYANAAHGAARRGDRRRRRRILVGDEPCEVVVETPGHAADHIAGRRRPGVLRRCGRLQRRRLRRRVVRSHRHGGPVPRGADREPSHAPRPPARTPPRRCTRAHGDVYRASDGPDTVREVIERATERARRRASRSTRTSSAQRRQVALGPNE